MAENYNTLEKRKFRKLEDLNLLDDFLFREMVASPIIGEEFCKILLRTILGKEVRKVKITPQRTIAGTDTNRHGIRLDAYIEDITPKEVTAALNSEKLDAEIIQDIFDFEPNKVYEKKIIPRKVRYYHGLIDTKLLESGIGYENLPNVFIIMILPYDPFDKNRMVYTIKNHCVEDASLEYEDGATKIFLYTKGISGNPSQNLIDMLKYIENSIEENIVNQDIERIHNMVRQIKQNKEVCISYMKSWEWEEYIKKQATEEGMREGMEKGKFILLYEMVQDGDLSLEKASDKADMPMESFISKMEKAGYKVPVSS